jgi:hypothetical protein
MQLYLTHAACLVVFRRVYDGMEAGAAAAPHVLDAMTRAG